MMRKHKYILWGMALFFSLSACIEPLEIEITDQVQLLVVEGLITDGEGPYTVKLRWSNPVDKDTLLPVNGARVVILEEGGVSEELGERSPGVFLSTANGIRGKAGNRYMARVILANGEIYESEWTTLKASPPIDKVHFQYEERGTINGTLRGLDILVDTQDPTGNSQFYRYEYVETWRYRAPFPPLFIYLGNNNTISLSPDKETCYMTAFSDQINTATSVDNNADVIADHLVTYVTTETNRLLSRYSILVKQYVLNEEEYLFWNSVQESIENVGNLFDTQPQSIIGNMKNIEDPGEPVLGYFSVAGESEKRIFISPNDDLPVSPGVDPLFSNCFENLDSIPVGPMADEIIFSRLDLGRVFYNFYGQIGIEGYILTTVPCSDCTYFGGTTVKPDFWID